MSDEALVDRIANGLNRAWWLPLVRGLLMLVLGLLLRIEPLIVFDTIVVVFGLFLIIDGAVAAIYGLIRRHQAGAHWWLAQAVVGVAFGLMLLVSPQDSLAVVVLVFGIFALVSAAIHVVSAFAVRDARRALPAVG